MNLRLHIKHWLIVCGILVPMLVHGQTPVQLYSLPVPQFFSASGVPLSGGILCSFQSGTNTPLATYTSSAGTTQQTNPIRLNSAGRPTSPQIWLSGSAYKFLLAAGGTCNSPSGLQWTVDPVQVGVFASGNNTFSGNNNFSGTNTFSGPLVSTDGGSLNGTYAGNPNFSGSPTFSGPVTFSANVSAPQLQSTVGTGTPPLIVTSTTPVPNLDATIVNGVAYSATAPAHSVPVVTTANTTSTYNVLPDCPSLGFVQSTDSFSCQGGYKVENVNTVFVNVSNTTAATNMMQFTLPANELAANQVLRIRAGGVYGSTGGPTAYIWLAIDGTVIGNMAPIGTGGINGGDLGWDVDLTLIVATDGAGGTITSIGGLLDAATISSASSFGQFFSMHIPTTGTASFDTTVSHTIAMRVQWDTADVSDIATQRQMIVERLN